jgi:hypothetical protein
MSWFGTVMMVAQAARLQRQQIFTFEQLVLPGLETPRDVEPDDEYVTITVRSSHICDVRRWQGKFHAAIHARAHYLHQDQGDVEFQTMFSPKLFRDVDPVNLDRVISVDKVVLGPVPYVGGVTLELGLFSVGNADLMSPYLDLLGNVADAAGSAFVSAVKPFAAPLRQGLSLLFGDPNRSELEIGIDISWKDLRTGTWLLMRAPTGIARPADLRLHPESFHLLRADGTPWVEHPYVVLSIAADRRRADYMKVPDIKQAWDMLRAAALGDDPVKITPLLRRFETICRWSPDLVPTDAAALIAKARARATPPEEAAPTTAGRLAAPQVVGRELGELGDLNLYAEA